MPNIQFTIQGTPRTYGNNEMNWRSTIATHVRRTAQMQGLQIPITGVSAINVKLTFYLAANRFYVRNDLDNLVKPILDTLFRAHNPQVPPDLFGVLFDCDDELIYSLHLDKVGSSGDNEGAIVTFQWI